METIKVVQQIQAKPRFLLMFRREVFCIYLDLHIKKVLKLCFSEKILVIAAWVQNIAVSKFQFCNDLFTPHFP